MLTAKQIMTKEVITASPHHSLKVVYALMKHYGIRHVPIVENHKVLGVVSEAELLLRSHSTADGKVAVPDQPSREALNPAIVSCRSYTPVANIAATMITYKNRCVLVADKTLKGIITTSNILDQFCFDIEMDGRKVTPLPAKPTAKGMAIHMSTN